MNIQKIDEKLTRQILTGMIVSDKFLKDVAKIYDPSFILVPFAKMVAGWCLDYYKRYDKAPAEQIQDIFNVKRRGSLPNDQAEIIEEFLSGLSDDFERSDRFNAEYLIDQTERLFNERKLAFLSEDIQALIDKGDLEGATELVINHRRVQRPQSKAINALTDAEAIRDALTEEEGDRLFKMPGILGTFLGWFERDMLVGIMGPSKRGKSWRLLDIAFRALREKCNVAYFQAGDLSRRQIMRRVHTYNTMASAKYGGKEILVPMADCVLNQSGLCTEPYRENAVTLLEGEERLLSDPVKALKMSPTDYKPCSVCMFKRNGNYIGSVWWRPEVVKPINIEDAIAKGTDTIDKAGKGFKLSVHPNKSLSVRDIETELDLWEQEDGFVPDVIVVDYMDIMRPENTKQEVRHQENEKWSDIRALSQKRHCLVAVATQADAASYSQESLKEKNFSEDKRKYDHVNLMLTLNQTYDEKKMGIMRIGKFFVREDDYDVRDQVVVLQSLPIGRPYLASYEWKRG